MKDVQSFKLRFLLAGLLAGVLVVGGGQSANADFVFGTPVNLGSPPNSSYADVMPNVSSDGLEMYFWSNQPGGYGDWDLWVSTRASTDDGWSPPTNVGAKVNTAGTEGFPCISADGLELYFSLGNESTGELLTQLSQLGIEIDTFDSANKVSFHHKADHLADDCIPSVVAASAISH